MKRCYFSPRIPSPRSILPLIGLLSAVLLTTACQQAVSTNTVPPASVLSPPHSLTKTLNQFQLKGKVSLRQEKHSALRASPSSTLYTADIHWKQLGDHYQIDLSAPLNQGHIKIEGNPTRATLWDTKANAHQTASPEQLLEHMTGVDFPLGELRQWITGRPDLSGVDAEQIQWETDPTGQHHVSSFRKNGWRVRYKQWSYWNEYCLPKKMELRDNTRVVKVFIYAWDQLPNTLPTKDREP